MSSLTSALASPGASLLLSTPGSRPSALQASGCWGTGANSAGGRAWDSACHSSQGRWSLPRTHVTWQGRWRGVPPPEAHTLRLWGLGELEGEVGSSPPSIHTLATKATILGVASL